MEIWEPKPPGTLWATPGLLRNCFTSTFHIYTLAVEGAAPTVFVVWLRAWFRLEQRRKKPLGRPRYRRKNNIKIVLKMEENGLDLFD
jgi:hypothetical protein